MQIRSRGKNKTCYVTYKKHKYYTKITANSIQYTKVMHLNERFSRMRNIFFIVKCSFCVTTYLVHLQFTLMQPKTNVHVEY